MGAAFFSGMTVWKGLDNEVLGIGEGWICWNMLLGLRRFDCMGHARDSENRIWYQ